MAEMSSGTRARLRLRLAMATVVVGVAAASVAVLPASVVSAHPVGPLFAASVAQGSGDCTSASNACTLTTALGEVAPGGTIELVTPGSTAHYVGVFTLSTGTASLPVTIEPAPGITDPILDGNDGSSTDCPTTSCLSSVLTVLAGVDATIAGLTVENGLTAPGTNGGGINNLGNLTLTNDVVTANITGSADGFSSVNGGGGGGIFNSGTLALTDDTVTNNYTGTGEDSTIGEVNGNGNSGDDEINASLNFGNGGDGGGIDNLGTVTMTDDTVSGNQTGSASTSTIFITQGNGNADTAVVSGNENDANGGNGAGINNAGSAFLTDDTVSGNHTGPGGNTGGITITQGNGNSDRATFSNDENGGNGGNGGGIDNSGTLTLSNDTVAGNQTGAGGIIGGLNSDQGDGTDDATTIENTDNGANGGGGGGIDNSGTLTLSNDTVAGNQTGAGGSGPSGAAIDGTGSGLVISFSGNNGDGLDAGVGGDIDNGGTTTVAATIVASAGTGGDCAGSSTTDQGYNIDSDGTCSFTGTGSVSGSGTLNASLGPLGPNGGLTNTIAISGGPAVGLVHSATLCAPADQRGVERPSLVCDAGAYEFTAANGSIGIFKSASVDHYSDVGTPITYRYKVANNGNVNLTNVTVTDPMSGLSSINCGSGTNSVPSLAVGSSVTCTATYATTLADLMTGSITNTGSVVGTPPVGTNVTSSSPLTISSDVSASVEIVKAANVSSYAVPGTPITYSYKVTNNGNITLTNVTVTDPMSGLSSINCGGGTNSVTTLSTGSSVTCTATYTATLADLMAGSLTNTGSVVATPLVGTKVSSSSPLTIPAKACGAGLTTHFLTATASAGKFVGVFCVNAAGTGSYTQYSSGSSMTQTASGTGTIKVAGATTAVSASGTNLALLGQRTSTTSSFTETAPAPLKSGTFTLT